MATIKSEYYRFNGVSWDIHYFKTTMDMVDGLTSALNGKANISGANFTGGISSRMFTQTADGVPTNNLGSPTVTEMALFQEQFNNKTEFFDTSLVVFETYNGTTWTDISSSLALTQKKMLLGGDGSSTITIPNGVIKYRITLRANAYAYLNALYCYWSGNGNSTQVHIWKKHDSGSWTQHTSSSVYVSSWPGHLYLPFSTIPWNSGATLGSHWHEVRVEFTPNWTHATNGISLHKFQLWGGYPAGKRSIYSTDENRNVAFPANLSANGQLVVLNNDTRLTNARPASDVYAWAKEASKPSYSWSEIGSKPTVMTTTEGNAGTAITERTINAANLKAIILNHSPAGARPASDVSAWAKEASKPSYSWSEIGSKPTWIGSSKPDYTWSEIGSKPTWIGASKPSYSWSEISDKPKVVLNASTSIYNDIIIKAANDTISLESSADRFNLSDEGIPSLHCGPASDGLFEVYGSISSTGTISASGDIFTNNRRVQKQSTPVNISSSVTLNSSHLDTMIVCRNTSAMTLTIPLQTILGPPPHGTEIHFVQYSTGKVTISPVSGVTIVSKDSKRAIDGRYAAATLKLIDNNVWILVGALQS